MFSCCYGYAVISHMLCVFMVEDTYYNILCGVWETKRLALYLYLSLPLNPLVSSHLSLSASLCISFFLPYPSISLCPSPHINIYQRCYSGTFSASLSVNYPGPVSWFCFIVDLYLLAFQLPAFVLHPYWLNISFLHSSVKERGRRKLEAERDI